MVNQGKTFITPSGTAPSGSTEALRERIRRREISVREIELRFGKGSAEAAEARKVLSTPISQQEAVQIAQRRQQESRLRSSDIAAARRQTRSKRQAQKQRNVEFERRVKAGEVTSRAIPRRPTQRGRLASFEREERLRSTRPRIRQTLIRGEVGTISAPALVSPTFAAGQTTAIAGGKEPDLGRVRVRRGGYL